MGLLANQSLLKISNKALSSLTYIRPQTNWYWGIPLRPFSSSSRKATLHERIPTSAYALLVLPCITFGLGIWQVKRRKWKIQLIESLEKKLRRPGVKAPNDLAELGPEREYEQFILDGDFIHEKQMFVGPRMKLTDETGGLISTSGFIGVHVITPFRLSQNGEVVLVNRGWISMDEKQNAGNIYRPDGCVNIRGIYRQSEKGSFGTANVTYDDRMSMWSRRDVSALANATGSEAYLFDQNEHPSNYVCHPGEPIPGQTVVQLRNEHASYILTWFSLTIILSAIWSRRYLWKTSRRNLEILMEKSKK